MLIKRASDREVAQGNLVVAGTVGLYVHVQTPCVCPPGGSFLMARRSDCSRSMAAVAFTAIPKDVGSLNEANSQKGRTSGDGEGTNGDQGVDAVPGSPLGRLAPSFPTPHTLSANSEFDNSGHEQCGVLSLSFS